MKIILVIDDSSSASRQAAMLALSIAQQTGAHLLVANVDPVGKKNHADVYALVAVNATGAFAAETQPSLPDMLNGLNDKPDIFRPDIRVLPGIETAAELAAIINEKNIWMVVSGIPAHNFPPKFNLQVILNKVKCPLLLVPENFNKSRFEHIVYTADLRYCRMEIVRYLAKLAGAGQSALLIAHLSASGLPHLADAYAETIFSEDIYPLAGYPPLYYQNIRERDMTKAADVLINGMHADLLVLENHRFHFEEIFGGYISHQPHLTVPVLIFPC